MARINPLFDIEDMALEAGATVEYADGRKFNTAGVQAPRQKKVAPPPPPPTPAPPPAPDANAALVKQLMALLNRPVQVSLPELPAPNVVVNPPAVAAPRAPTKWVFEFERNSNGTIKSITATASKE